MKQLIKLIIIFLLLFPAIVLAQESETEQTSFEAEVIEIIDSRELLREDGSKIIQQDVKLLGLTNGWQDKEIIAQGINNLDVIQGKVVKPGDKVVVAYLKNIDNEENFYITDIVRRSYLYLLLVIFIILTILIGRTKGAKALLSLAITFAIIVWGIIPLIMHGYNPLIVTILGSLLILTSIIYITWGIKRQSHLALISISISLLITGILSIIFSNLSELSGLADENVVFLIESTSSVINFKGLLLAGIIIGTLGVLDDVVISQISTVQEIKKANSNFGAYDLFKRGMRVGVDHISSMINTLFLAYVGVSLPLLLLFKVKSGFLVTWTQAINNEIVATEIVRSLLGSIGLIIAVPIATLIAARYLKE
ncbi:MAG: YibE/F family protein [bacterium]